MAGLQPRDVVLGLGLISNRCRLWPHSTLTTRLARVRTMRWPCCQGFTFEPHMLIVYEYYYWVPPFSPRFRCALVFRHGFDEWHNTEASASSSTPNCGCVKEWAADSPGCIVGGGAWEVR